MLCGARSYHKTSPTHPAHNRPAMRFDQTELYEDFVRARQEAMELTDRYHATPPDATGDRDALWEHLVRQTETARTLLEAWLDSSEDEASTPPPAPAQEPVCCLISAP